MIATPGSATLPFDVHGSGPGVVLLHAGVTDRRGWAPLLPVLRPDHRVVAFDARGFGESSYEPEPFSRATDAVAVMDAADLGPAVLIGNSMGGKTAIDVAIDHPDRVTALVLIGAPISGAPQGEDDPPEVRALWEEMKDAEEAEDLDALNRLEARFWLDGVPAPEGRVTGATRDLFLEMNGRALAAPDPGEEDRSSVAWTRLEEIVVPTLFLVGDLDLEEFQRLGEQAASRIPGATFVGLAGVAHLPVLEGDPACLTAISQFVGSLGPALQTRSSTSAIMNAHGNRRSSGIAPGCI